MKLPYDTYAGVLKKTEIEDGITIGDIRQTDDQNLFDVLVKLYQDTIKMQEVRK